MAKGEGMLRRIKEVLSGLDIYAQPINLNFKGHESYSTWTGIIASFAIFGFVGLSFISLV
jgi:hypothetical protein